MSASTLASLFHDLIELLLLLLLLVADRLLDRLRGFGLFRLYRFGLFGLYRFIVRDKALGSWLDFGLHLGLGTPRRAQQL